MKEFNIGDLVHLPEEQYSNIAGTVIYFNKKTNQYLVRFNGSQQLYFSSEQLSIWDK